MLRAIYGALAMLPSTLTEEDLAANRAMLRGAMRAYLERTEAETDHTGATPPTAAG